jgi:hypothetical protein
MTKQIEYLGDSGDGSEDDGSINSENKATALSGARYRNWKGNNVFLCGGGLMLGPHVEFLRTSMLIIVGTWAAFIWLLAPLINRIECYQVALGFLLANMVFLLSTAFTEPGIIPRRKRDLLTDTMCEEIQLNVQQYCTVCNIVRPPRTKHCKYCDNCVRTFDHHCPVSLHKLYVLQLIILCSGACAI